MEPQHEYEFIYRCNGVTLSSKFNASVDIEKLKENLKQFLLCCTWTESTLEFLEPEDD